MKHQRYLIQDEEGGRVYPKLKIGNPPKNTIGVIPDHIALEDLRYVTYREVPDPEFPDQFLKEVYLDEDAKSAGLSEAIQEGRNSKLQLMRSLRNEKLQECDNMVRDLALGERSDQIPIRDYRAALKAITDDYKYVNDSAKGKAALDFFAEDMSDFTWPTKP